MAISAKPVSEADRARAAALHQQQLLEGEEILNAPAKRKPPRLSPEAFEGLEVLYAANKMQPGERPLKVPKPVIDHLIDEGIVTTNGVGGRGKRYTVAFRPNEVTVDDSLTMRKPRGRRRVAAAARPAPVPRGNFSARDVAKFVRYLDTNRESWLAHTRETIKGTNPNLALAIDKLGYDAVARYVHKVDSLVGGEAWKRHLEDNFGPGLVSYCRDLIEAREEE